MRSLAPFRLFAMLTLITFGAWLAAMSTLRGAARVAAHPNFTPPSQPSIARGNEALGAGPFSFFRARTWPAAGCRMVCFRSPQYWLLNLNRLPRGTVLIGGVNFNNPVSTTNISAIRLALEGGGSIAATPSPLKQLNRQFVAAQLSLAATGALPASSSLQSPLSCYGFARTITLDSGAPIAPDATLNDLFQQAGSALRANRAADMSLLAQIFEAFNGTDPLGRCGGVLALLPTPLTIEITEPVNAVTFNTARLRRLRGRIILPPELAAPTLARATLEVRGLDSGGSYSLNLTAQLLPSPLPSSGFIFAVNDLSLFPGRNELTVRAEAAGSLPNRGPVAVSGMETISVVFRPPPPNLNIYALGLEVTQAVQGDEIWNGVAGPDPPAPRSAKPAAAIPYQVPGTREGVPLVAHKSAVARVYGAVENTPGAEVVRDVPARLIGRRGGAPLPGAPLLAYLTLDPADNVRRTDGTLDLALTLEKQRREIGRSWNFVLPDSWTSETGAEAPEIEVQINPPDLAGPPECAGCHDAANKLTVSGIKFLRTASLAIRSFYVSGDGNEAGADAKVFCGAFLNMYPVRDGCGTGPIDSNDLNFGINLLSLRALIERDSNGNIILDRGFWQDRMCKTLVADFTHTLPFFTPPAAYVALGPDGLGGAPGNNIVPAACAAVPFPGFFEEYRYGVAAQEIGHGDFTSRRFGATWHACGPGELAAFPKYRNARGDQYYKGSIGQFGLDTAKMVVKDPTQISDFMGYTYCDQWTADEQRASGRLLIRANAAVRIGESSPLPATSDLIAKGVGGTVTTRGLTFRLEALTPATSARLAEALIAITGTATAGDLFLQIGSRPALKVFLTAGQSIEILVGALGNGLRNQPDVDIREREPFSAFPWVSPFTFNVMFAEFRAALNTTAAARGAQRLTAGAEQVSGAREYLLAGGQIGLDAQVALAPFRRLTLPAGTADEAGTGVYDLELQNQHGQVLFVRHFDPQPAHPEQPQINRFSQTLPFVPGATCIVLKQGNDVLAKQVLSAHTPTVTILAPNGGERWGSGGEQVIQWMASDADGDRLSYLVQYSRDGGQSWQTLATEMAGNQLAVNTAWLPGSDRAMVRVIATDGVNTGQAQSNTTFTVARKEPAIWITGVADNAVVEPDAALNLQANIIAPDGEPLRPEDFLWSVDGGEPLGIGPRLELAATKLLPGAHRINLIVPGERGRPLTASITILRVPRGREVARGAR